MDYVGVRRVAPDGAIVGESRLLGLFTTKAYAEPASETPLLHRKLRRALDAEDLIEGSHDYKAAVAVFDSFPKDELFAAPVEDLQRAVAVLMGLEGTDQVRLLARRDPDGRSASMILSLPRERYGARLVEGMEAYLRQRFDGAAVTPHHVLEEGARVRVHYTVHNAGGLPEFAPRRAPARGDRARAHVGRRGPRGADRAPRRGARARARRGLGAALPRPLPGLHRGRARRPRRRLLRPPRRRRERRRLAAARRGRHADARRALQARRQGRALDGDADARGPRAARGGGDRHAARRLRGRDLGAGVPRARPGRAARRPRRRRRPAGGRDRRRLPRRSRVGPAQPPRDRRRAGPRPAGDPARLPQVPPAGRLALHRGLPERRAHGQRGRHRQARAPLRAALRRRRDGRAARRGRRGGAARGDPRRSRRRRLARPRPHPAQPALGDRRDAAHERLQARPRRPGVQDPLRRRARRPRARAAGRGLRLRLRGRGHPPARRPDRPRRDPLVGPDGLPHRGLRADARAADQERDHRPGRRQGRLHRQAPAERPRGAARGGRDAVRDLHPGPARRDRQPRRRRGRPPRGRARARRRRHLPGRRGRQGHGDVLGPGQRDRPRRRLLARRRVRLRRLLRLRPQGPRDHRARRLGVGQAPLPRARARPGRRRADRRRDRRHVRRRVRQRDAAVGQAEADRRLRPPARVPGPVARPGHVLRRAPAPVRPQRLLLGRLRPRADLRGRRRLAAQREVDPAARRRSARRSASRTSGSPRPT